MQVTPDTRERDAGGRDAEDSNTESSGSESPEETKYHHFRHMPLKIKQLQPGWVRKRKPKV